MLPVRAMSSVCVTAESARRFGQRVSPRLFSPRAPAVAFMKVSALYFLFLLKAGRMFVLYNLSIVWYNQRQNHTNFQVIGTQTPPKNNTSGHKGISWDADRKMWIAYINVHNKRVFLGRYAKLDAAVEARKRAEEKYHAPLIAQRDAETEGKNDVG